MHKVRNSKTQMALREPSVRKSSLKLTLELVPRPCFYNNLRNQMSASAWEKVRKRVYAEYHHQCGICGAKRKKLQCHEIWSYDDAACIQKLTGFIALCPLCHHCKHIGYAGILAEQGKLDLKRVEEHFCRVNQCTYREFQAHEAEELSICRRRNRYKWTTDLGDYACLVTPPKQPDRLPATAVRNALPVDKTKEELARMFYEQLEKYYVPAKADKPRTEDCSRDFWRQLEKYYLLAT